MMKNWAWSGKLKHRHFISGLMMIFWCFRSRSKSFKSYQDIKRIMMKGSVQ